MLDVSMAENEYIEISPEEFNGFAELFFDLVGFSQVNGHLAASDIGLFLHH